MNAYLRTSAQKLNDFHDARKFEEEVGEHLPEYKLADLTHNDRLDFWVPGFYVEVKEKKQRLTPRWHLLPGVPERDLFVMDELTVRRALRHFPEAYFLIRDVPENRLFIASITDFVVVERVRRNRGGKGKWIVNLQNFHRLAGLDDITEYVMADLVAMPWKKSEALSQLEVPQI